MPREQTPIITIHLYSKQDIIGVLAAKCVRLSANTKTLKRACWPI